MQVHLFKSYNLMLQINNSSVTINVSLQNWYILIVFTLFDLSLILFVVCSNFAFRTCTFNSYIFVFHLLMAYTSNEITTYRKNHLNHLSQYYIFYNFYIRKFRRAIYMERLYISITT